MNDIQEVILEIYKEIKKVCDKHNITYYGIDGTCLGAVRHQGFIPWDDDMDIGIPIEEFDKFIKVAKQDLPDYLEIYDPFENKNFTHLIIKVIDTRTTFVEKPLLDYPDSWFGVWVDIIPLCGVPKNKLKENLFYSALSKNMFLNLYLREDHLGRHFTSVQKIVKNYVVKHRDIDYYMNKQLKLIKKYPMKGSAKVLEVGFLPVKQWITQGAYYGKGQIIKFEDTDLPVPQNYDKYLTDFYGDYMKIPDVKNQVQHTGFIDLNQSYKYYVEHPEQVKVALNNKE